MAGADRGKLAIHGGEMAVPDGTVKHWPPIGDLDREYVLKSLADGRHAFGPNAKALGEEYARWNGNRFAIASNSGTAALHMGVFACGCGAGDEIIVTAYSWSSSATCILHHNCIPVFVDIDFRTMTIDPDKIEAAITRKTKAIIVVHLQGLMADMEKIMAIARRHNLKVIEDACQAHGSEVNGRRAGRWGDCAAFSLNQNKCLCGGEGGIFATDSEELWEKAKMLWSFGETRTPLEDRDYHVYALGWMYRYNDLSAAFTRAQLTRLDEYLATQARNAAALTRELEGIPGLVLPWAPATHRHNWYNYTVRLDPGVFGYADRPRQFRDAVCAAVRAEGAPVGVYQGFILPRMTVFQAKNGYGSGCPWTCPYYGGTVDYDPARFPEAQRHCDNHFGMTEPLRAPNDETTAAAVGRAIRKVLENVKDLEVPPPEAG